MTAKERFCNKRCCSNPCRHICEYLSRYLDGLAEGKPKWHDLRKNSDDLPKYKNSSVNRICWINEYGNKCYHDAFYDNKGFYWISEKTYTKHYPVIDVIAWTELPMFEE